MKRKLMLAAPLFVFALIAACFALQPGREKATVEQFQAHRPILEELAQQVLERESSEGIVPPAPWLGVELYDAGIHTVEFTMGGSGIGSETKY